MDKLIIFISSLLLKLGVLSKCEVSFNLLDSIIFNEKVAFHDEYYTTSDKGISFSQK